MVTVLALGNVLKYVLTFNDTIVFIYNFILYIFNIISNNI